MLTTLSGQVNVSHLTRLADEINIVHAKCLNAAGEALEHAIRCGELLTKAKGRCGHGDWAGWVRSNCSFAMRTAQAYMRISRNQRRLTKAPPVALLTVRGALDVLSEKRPAPEPPGWKPPGPGMAMLGTCGPLAAWIIPHVQDGYYYVSQIQDQPDGSATIDGTNKGMHVDAIETCLRHIHFPIEQAAWSSVPHKPAHYNELLYSSRQEYITQAILARTASSATDSPGPT
jgi:hypothetical protein